MVGFDLGFDLGSSWRGGVTDQLLKLFGPSDNGLLFDNLAPSYKKNGLNILYKDQAGTPVSADGQSAALMLDRSKGLKLGSELVTNGGFDTDTSGWSIYTGTPNITWISGSLQFSSANAGIQSAVTFSGGLLRLRFRRPLGSTTTYIHLRNAANTIVTQTSTDSLTLGADGYYSWFAYCAAAITKITFAIGGSADTVQLDDVSLKALPGNHALQTTAASQMTAKSGTPWYLSADGGDSYYCGDLPLPNNEVTMAMLCYNTQGSSIIVGGQTQTPQAYAYVGLNASGYVASGYGNTGSWLNTVGSVDLRSQNHVILFRAKVGTQQAIVDGVIAGTGTVTTSPPTSARMNIGAFMNSGGTITSWMAGKMFRSMMINRYVTDAEVQIITKALAKDVVTL